MKINHLITIFLIAAVAVSVCLSKKPKDNKPVEITFSAAVSFQEPLTDAGAQFQEN